MPRTTSIARPLRRAVPTAAVALVLLLSACSSGSEDPAAESGQAGQGSEEALEETRPMTLEPGTCWTGEQLPVALGPDDFPAWVEEYAGGDERLGEAMADDAAFTEEVDCAEPHALELYATVGLPEDLDAEVGSYADLLDPATDLYRRVSDVVNQRCLAGSVWGEAEREAGDLRVQLAPALSEAGGLRLAWDPFPADLWEDGQRQFVCTLEQDEPGTIGFDDLGTSATPQRARVCLDIPGETKPCGAPHQAEEIGEMTLNLAIEAGEINAERALRDGDDGPVVALADAEYDRLDEVCTTLFEAVSTGRPDVEAQAFPGGVDQWPTEEGDYVASCFALKPFDPPPPFRGTVFDR